MGDFASYKNKRVVVSGCFSGMGEATARLLLDLGAEVHGLDYKDTQLKLASFTRVDLRDPASIDAAAKSIGGKVDALFNCAGLPQTAGALDVMKVNYAGTRRLTEQVLPLMSAGGAIVSISSNGGLGWSRRAPDADAVAEDRHDRRRRQMVRRQYGDGARRLCLLEGSHHRVDDDDVDAISSSAAFASTARCPDPTQTPMMEQFEAATAASVIEAAAQPINRRSTPKNRPAALVFLNSDAASYINGVALPVDGGFLGGVATGQIDLSAMMAGAAKPA